MKVETNARLAWAVFGGILDYMIDVLEVISKNQRDIADILDQEKAVEKEKYAKVTTVGIRKRIYYVY